MDKKKKEESLEEENAPEVEQGFLSRIDKSKINFDKLKELQRKLAREVVLKDKVKFKDIKTVAGFDISYEQDAAICAAVVLDFESMEAVDEITHIARPSMPYISSFLSFREGPIIIAAYEKLNIKPDILIVNGHGVLHPLKSGLACFVGVNLEKPTIGVAKKLICGSVKGSKVFVGEMARGAEIRTKEHANPLYVSVGNMISTNTAIDVINKCMKPPHKLPEPLHIAHKNSKSARDELRKAEKVVEKEENKDKKIKE